MNVDALKPNDPRVEHKFTKVGDLTYHYMLAKPKEKPTATIFLIHGWPDLGMGWRNQVPYLLSLNLQVVVPDMLGYGQTSAPEPIDDYTLKKMSGHIAQIVKEVTDQPIILGGHDWGGYFVWRMTLYYPELIRAVFSICVPFNPPLPVVVTLEQVVEKFPNFTYQLQIANGSTEKIVHKEPGRIRGFVNGMFHGTTPERKPMFTIEMGVIEENIDNIGPSPLLDAEMVDFYVQEYSRNGLHGPCNWYRTRELNGKDELELAKVDSNIKVPAMLIMADQDAALPVSLSEGQEKFFPGGLKKEVIQKCSHWAMIQKPAEVNHFIGEFVRSILGDESKAVL